MLLLHLTDTLFVIYRWKRNYRKKARIICNHAISLWQIAQVSCRHSEESEGEYGSSRKARYFWQEGRKGTFFSFFFLRGGLCLKILVLHKLKGRTVWKPISLVLKLSLLSSYLVFDLVAWLWIAHLDMGNFPNADFFSAHTDTFAVNLMLFTMLFSASWIVQIRPLLPHSV